MFRWRFLVILFLVAKTVYLGKKMNCSLNFFLKMSFYKQIPSFYIIFFNNLIVNCKDQI